MGPPGASTATATRHMDLWRDRRHRNDKGVWCDGRQVAIVNRARHACVLKYFDSAPGLESTPRAGEAPRGPPGASTATATRQMDL
jgi:hypothetical protein